jgi:hypothetical protein
MKVWLIRISNMSGNKNDYLVYAFTSERTCKLRCKDMQEEYQDYIPEAWDGEEISGDRIIIDRKVYDLDRTDATEEIKRRAKEKLDPEEREVLGLNDD